MLINFNHCSEELGNQTDGKDLKRADQTQPVATPVRNLQDEHVAAPNLAASQPGPEEPIEPVGDSTDPEPAKPAPTPQPLDPEPTTDSVAAGTKDSVASKPAKDPVEPSAGATTGDEPKPDDDLDGKAYQNRKAWTHLTSLCG